MSPAAVQDNLSSCRSSPMQWKPMPVPAPAFDGYRELVAAEENVSWEHCMRILNNSGRSFPRSGVGAAYPVFGTDRPNGIVSRSLSAKLSEVKVEEVAVTIHDGGNCSRFANSVSRATSPLPSEYSDFPTIPDGSKDSSPQRRNSILKRIFAPLGQRKKSLSRSSSVSSLFTTEEPLRQPRKAAKSPPPRLSSVGLTGDADPRISSVGLTENAPDYQEHLASQSMRRWLRHQRWTAMAAKAENNLHELSEMLQDAMKSMSDMKELDHVAEEFQQRRNSVYYAS